MRSDRIYCNKDPQGRLTQGTSLAIDRSIQETVARPSRQFDDQSILVIRRMVGGARRRRAPHMTVVQASRPSGTTRSFCARRDKELSNRTWNRTTGYWQRI